MGYREHIHPEVYTREAILHPEVYTRESILHPEVYSREVYSTLRCTVGRYTTP